MVAFSAILETGEVGIHAVSAVVGLASFDGHAGKVAIAGAGEGAQTDGVVSAAQVAPAGGGELGDAWGVDWWTGGRDSSRDFGR